MSETHTKHTEGALLIRSFQPTVADSADGMFCIFDSRQPGAIGEANARRLVACWNACLSVPTEELERVESAGIMKPGILIMSPEDFDALPELKRLLTENARLREALQRILIASDRRMADGGEKLDYQDTNRQAGDVARAALARSQS